MIKVNPAPEPPDFDQAVRQPGQTYLNGLNAGDPINFANREYWRRCLRDLHSSYQSICAYTCHWIALDTGNGTVEHFKAKSLHPDLAYEWENYRLVCGRLNGRKGAHEDVIDPFFVTDGMFAIDFPSLQITVGDEVSVDMQSIALSTVERLNLNDERCILSRLEYVEDFRDAHIDFDYLSRRAPFLASELIRQGIRDKLNEIMKPN